MSSSTTTIMCANHPDSPVASFCRTCGKALCVACRRPAAGTVFCDEHVPVGSAADVPPPPRPTAYDNPWTAPQAMAGPGNPMSGNSPALAFLLGMIPGVGAIYNGQYAKGLVHAVIFGLLITAVSSHSLNGWEPLFGILIAVFEFYMALEAFHTARKRQAGETVDEFSSLVAGSGEGGFPTGAIVLIALGFLLLLNTLNVLSFESVVRFWPVGLILIGAFMLYNRTRGGVR